MGLVKVKDILNTIWDILTLSLFKIGESSVTLMSIVYLISAILLSIWISKLIIRVLKRKVFPKTKIEEGLQYALARLIRYTLITLGAIIGLQMVGFDLSALTVFAGLFGVGLGFGLQNIISNFASGLVVLFERPIKVGDVVKIGQTVGIVEDIKMRVTVINTYDNETIIVPNSNLIEKEVVNWSYKDLTLRLRIPVGVSYGCDVNLVREKLLEVADELPHVKEKPEPYVHFKGFGDSSLDFELRLWIPSPNYRMNVSSEARFKIKEKFGENDIEIPFPQRDVWLKSNEKGNKQVENLQHADQ